MALGGGVSCGEDDAVRGEVMGWMCARDDDMMHERDSIHVLHGK